MSYPRENTTQAAAASSANASVTLKLPNGTTSGGAATAKAIGANQRWRIRFLHASFGAAAAPTTPAALTVTDGVFTFTFDVTGPLVLANIDWQCAAGAEVDFTLAAGGASLVGHINVTAVSES